jgi:hypothetical protein
LKQQLVAHLDVQYAWLAVLRCQVLQHQVAGPTHIAHTNWQQQQQQHQINRDIAFAVALASVFEHFQAKRTKACKGMGCAVHQPLSCPCCASQLHTITMQAAS